MARRKAKPAALPDQRWVPSSADLPPPPVAPDDRDQVVDALPAAEAGGHKVGRQRHHLFCWHCDATGSVTNAGPQGTIFTEKCKR